MGLVVIRARALEKRFGRKRALRPVDLAVARGQFAVVTGPNGSGKTTLLRLVGGSRADARRRSRSASTAVELGYVGHEPLLYRELTALENLDLYGRLYRVPERRERIGHAARAVRPLGRAARARRVRSRAA